MPARLLGHNDCKSNKDVDGALSALQEPYRYLIAGAHDEEVHIDEMIRWQAVLIAIGISEGLGRTRTHRPSVSPDRPFARRQLS